ncbi:DEAD-box ATP-dependent RNA helicase 38-like [Heracleum sosnowskyi]|uniref:RNA helicase n=1 Tax=Heracleum sosnowskyi TaxID=360622 RepID=A0AAD8J355_9APIA|nr:DEAD-box ATP-dependent RNA helicase 38-like [Heracleum sosnowskyi]KAK1396789.1 DEAD-box ATP-dependent RNA helicase 38-like [Heracleum sosnowskyi]
MANTSSTEAAISTPAETVKLPEEIEEAKRGNEAEMESILESLAIEDSESCCGVTGNTLYSSVKRFEDLNISCQLLKGLYVEMKFERPSKIQAVCLPMILTPPYKNLTAQAHNGSGKTTCFVIGMLSRVDPELAAPQALCICPTRELAIQNQEVVERMGKFTGITSVLAVPMEDHMLAECGFKNDSERIIKGIVKLRPNCQVLLFSATFNTTVKEFARKFVTEISGNECNHLFLKKEELSLDSVKQYKVYCPDEVSKIMVIKDKILEMAQKVGQIIIFVRTRNSASMLHRSLVEYGYQVTTIQGAFKQEDRDTIVKEFKDGLTQVLISTDLLARGFDQPQVNLVVNYDLPLQYDPSNKKREPDYEVYLHRIGRAGRFGRKGAVFNLLCNDRDNILMTKIENNFKSPVAEVASWESDADFEDALKKAGLM